MSTINLEILSLKHLLLMLRWADSHILLTEMLHLRRDIMMGLRQNRLVRVCKSATALAYQLLRKRDLLEWHLVDASHGGTEQRGSCE